MYKMEKKRPERRELETRARDLAGKGRSGNNPYKLPGSGQMKFQRVPLGASDIPGNVTFNIQCAVKR